jgi:hypothetical protein
MLHAGPVYIEPSFKFTEFWNFGVCRPKLYNYPQINILRFKNIAKITLR